MADRGINLAAAERFVLGVDDDGRLSIPYLTPAGPWHVKTRCILPDHHVDGVHVVRGCPKYKNTDGAEQHLYNAQALLGAQRVVVVEGEIDAISVEMAGVPAVGFPGAETWAKNGFWRWCFDSVEEVIVVADGDLPEKHPKNNGKSPDDPGWIDRGVGEDAARLVADSLRRSLLQVDVSMVVMPSGFDANSFINTHGQVEFLDQIGWF